MAGLLLSLSLVTATRGTNRSFVPPAAPISPVNYWTTWYVQNYPGNNPLGGMAMGDKQLFSQSSSPGCPGCGWATFFYHAARPDLLLVLDDTWFVKPSNFSNQWMLDPVKFPAECKGVDGNWTKAMAALVASTKAAGWGGLGLWHHAIDSTKGNPSKDVELAAQLKALADAGVAHIKVDGTDMEGAITAVARQVSNGRLRVEHKQSPGEPLNGDPTKDGRALSGYISDLADLTLRTDVLRTDDIVCQMSIPTCLERHAQTLAALWNSNVTESVVAGALGVIAPQDEAYMAVGLAGSLAGMRHPLPQILGDTRLNGNRNLSLRVDEVTRSMRWARLAPPVGTFGYNGKQGRVLLDPSALTDAKVLTKDDSWFSKVWGKTTYQGAPARVTRGLKHLPAVSPVDSRYPNVAPWVVASKHPNGVIAVAALGRTLQTFGGWIMPRANITVYADAASPLTSPPVADVLAVVGVFGAVGTITIVWDSPIGNEPLTVWAQDLAGQTAVDVTTEVSWCNGKTSLVVPGSLIDNVGLSSATPGDISDPGVLLAITPSSNPTASAASVACPVIPPPPSPPVPPPPSPPPPPGPPPSRPIIPSDLNGTWVQQSQTKPKIDVIVTNGGGDVTIVGHEAGKWTTGSGVILDDTTIDAHCSGPNGFTTHQVGVASRVGDGDGLKITWHDGSLAGSNVDGEMPLAWAVWTKNV